MSMNQIEINTRNINTLNANIQNLTQNLNDLTNKVNQINLNFQQNVQAQIQNGLDTIAQQDIIGNERDDEARNKRKDFLRFRNIQRRISGLGTLNYVVCKICKQVNAHYTNYCPKQLCKICLGYGHSTKSCTERFKCQACGQTDHPTISCRTNEAIALRADRNRTCWRCGTKGHIAMNCEHANAGFRPRTTSRFRGYNRSQSRSRNRGRGGFKRGRGKGRY